MNYVNKNVEKDISFASLVDIAGDDPVPLVVSESATLRWVLRWNYWTYNFQAK